MSTSHIASIRAGNNNRMAAQSQKAASQLDSNMTDNSDDIHQSNTNERLQLETSTASQQPQQDITEKLSTISVSSSSDNLSQSIRSRHGSKGPKPVAARPADLEPITSVNDIESRIDPQLQQVRVLERLEQRWRDIVENLDDTLKHLNQSSKEITDASSSCLIILEKQVETTCDKVDAELKAMYHLMTKCDELVTKLSIATSFRDEIKTLRKSVETLEQLYKSKLQFEQQKKLSSTRNA